MATELSSVRLELFQTKLLVPIQTFNTSDTLVQKCTSEGSSILSTVFLKSKSVGAAYSISWYETTSGDEYGEMIPLESHDTVNLAVGGSNKILVTRLHNKPVLKLEVTSGTVELGVYITVVSNFASELDQTLVKDGQTADLDSDKGLQIALYDDDDGKFYFAKGSKGNLSFETSGNPERLISNDSLPTTPNVEQILITSTTPLNETWKLRNLRVVCGCYGFFVIMVDGELRGKGLTSPLESNVDFEFHPYELVQGLQLIEVKFTQTEGPVSEVQAFLDYTWE